MVLGRDRTEIEPCTCLLSAAHTGWQAALLSKLTLGSLVVTHRTLYPLWFDELLVSGQHLVRAQEADLTTYRRAKSDDVPDADKHPDARAGLLAFARACGHEPRVIAVSGQLFLKRAAAAEKNGHEESHAHGHQ